MSAETETVPDHQQEIEEAQGLADAHQCPVYVVREFRGPARVKMAHYLEEGDETLHVAVPRYRTLDDIKQRNERAGQCWFSPATMRFFSSRVQSAIYPTQHGGAYFVSSERGPDNIRKYTVRLARPDGSIDTVGSMGDYRTGRAAHAAARRLAEGGE